MIKAVAFDLDHTLFDRYATLTKICMESDLLFFSAGVPRAECARLLCEADRNYVYRDWDAVLDSIAPYVAPYVRRENFWDTWIGPNFARYAVPLPGVKEMLAELKAMGLRPSLITNGKHYVQWRKLKMLGLEGSFDEVIISGDFKWEKPSPELFLLLCDRLGLEPGELMYVGDNPLNDVEGSRRAGCVPVWSRQVDRWIHGIEGAPYSLTDVTGVPRLVKEINGGKSCPSI